MKWLNYDYEKNYQTLVFLIKCYCHHSHSWFIKYLSFFFINNIWCFHFRCSSVIFTLRCLEYIHYKLGWSIWSLRGTAEKILSLIIPDYKSFTYNPTYIIKNQQISFPSELHSTTEYYVSFIPEYMC